jgi:hypothetical protein
VDVDLYLDVVVDADVVAVVHLDEPPGLMLTRSAAQVSAWPRWPRAGCVQVHDSDYVSVYDQVQVHVYDQDHVHGSEMG